MPGCTHIIAQVELSKEVCSAQKNYEYQILLNGKKLDWNYYVLTAQAHTQLKESFSDLFEITAQGSKLIWLI